MDLKLYHRGEIPAQAMQDVEYVGSEKNENQTFPNLVR